MDNRDNIAIVRESAPRYAQDEIDLRELIGVLWRGKWTILLVTMASCIGAVTYAQSKPNLYTSTSSIIPNYAMMTGSFSKTVSMLLSPPYFILLKEEISSKSNLNSSTLKGVSLSVNKTTKVISLSETSLSASKAYNNVAVITNNLNQAVKALELSDVQIKLDSIAPLLSGTSVNGTKKAISEIYAELLYHKATLENPKTKLIQVLSNPVKATSHVQPNRMRIVLLGLMLGLALSIAFILVRFYFRKVNEG